MRCLGRTLSCLLLAVIIMIAPVSIWTVIIWDSVITNVDEYTASLDDTAYEDMAIFVIPGIAQIHSDSIRATNLNSEKALSLAVFAQTIIAIDRADWQSYIDGLFEPAWVREILNSNLQQLRAYLDFESTTLNAQADLKPVYDAISGETGEILAANVFESVRALDDCTNAQNRTVSDILAGDSVTMMPDCRPEDDLLAQVEIEFNRGRLLLATDLASVPDFQFDMRTRIAAENSPDGNIDTGPDTTNADLAEFDKGAHDMRRVLFLIDQTFVVILLFPLMILSLIVVVTVRSAKGFFLWTAIALLGTSTLTLLPLVPWIYGSIIENPRGVRLAGATDPALELGFEIQRQLLGALSGPVIVWVTIMAFIGIGFLLLAALLRSPNASTQQQVYYVMPGQTGSYPTPTGSGAITPAQQVMHVQQTPVPAPTEASVNTSPNQADSQQPQGRKSGGNTSAAERHKDSLSRPDLPNDRTFIPPNDESK